MNTRATRWAERISKSMTGGSDGHCLAELGSAVTICKADSVEEFLNTIKKKKSIAVGYEENLIDDAVHAVHKFLNEETKISSHTLEKMWKDRGLLEWDYLKHKIETTSLFHHFHAHHTEPQQSILQQHPFTKHLAKK